MQSKGNYGNISKYIGELIGLAIISILVFHFFRRFYKV